MRTLRGRIHWKRALSLTVLLSAVILMCAATSAFAAGPAIWADPRYDMAGIAGWPANAVIRIQIDSDNDRANGALLTKNLRTNSDGWAIDSELGGVDMQVGQYVIASYGPITRITHLVPVTVTGIDSNADTVSGTAGPGVDVFVYTSNDDVTRKVKADADGRWTADFKGAADIRPGYQGYADVWGGDDGYTRDNWYVAEPKIIAPVKLGFVDLFGWEWKSTVSITFDDDGDAGNGGVIYSANVTIPPFDPVAGAFGALQVNLPKGVTLKPGQYVTATGGGTTKVLRIPALAIKKADLPNDTLTGSADPGTQVAVSVVGKADPTTVTAAPDGSWIADFSAVCDIAVGDQGVAAQYDADRDAAFVPWSTMSLTIKTSAGAVRRGKQFVLSGVCQPHRFVGKMMHVDVKKPGKSYWTYSSNRVIYDNSGTAAWQYKYTTVPRMALGTYFFRAVITGEAGFPDLTTPAVRVLVIR